MYMYLRFNLFLFCFICLFILYYYNTYFFFSLVFLYKIIHVVLSFVSPYFMRLSCLLDFEF